MKWTNEQSEAINQEGSNIIVSAGAGSGKTAVLSERVLRKVREGVDIRNILILTFTNEAAGEMKNRIRKKLEKENLVEQLEYLDSAHITTFDAYALFIVKKYHYLLNIGKDINIIDSGIIYLEKMNILEEIFLDLYDKKDQNFLKLVGDFTNRDDLTIKKSILSISEKLDLKYDKKEYLDKYLNDFFAESNINKLFDEYFNYIKSLCLKIEDNIYALEGLVDEKLFIKLYDAYKGLFKPVTYNDIYKVKNIPVIRFKDVSEEALEYKDDLNNIKKEVLELTKYSEEELKEQLYSTKPYVEVIIRIILRLDERINDYKVKAQAFEFGDIAKMAIDIVSKNEDINSELKNTFNEILIDEYQDTNDLQEIFISEIQNNNVYMVGDIKQSIYRFRNANPNIFREKYLKYSKHINGYAIDLVKNFRSRSEVLLNINLIFGLLMSEEFGGVKYHDNHAMVYGNLAYINEGKNNYNNNMEILKYDNQDKEFKDFEIEAFIIASDIRKKVESKYQVFDFQIGEKRDVEYSDFCIILDRGTDMPKYKKIFEYLNIPMDVYLDSDLINESDLLIIKNIISLIININNKEYNKTRYNFVSIARSYIGTLTDNEIFNELKNNSFYDNEIYQKCFKLANDLNLKTPNSLLNEIIEDFNFYENLIKVGNVESAMFRIDYLLTLASRVESLGYTILDLRNYLDDLISSGETLRYKEKRGVGNCVKIMNIHKSKGLEFPICYFAGLKKDFNLKDLNSRFMFDNKYGILTPYFKEGIGTLLTKTLIKNNYKKEEISEKIRLFYVALTRAKEKIIMVLPEFKNEKQSKGMVSLNLIQDSRSFYDFLNNISLNLKEYISVIDINKLNLTKDYENGCSSLNYIGSKALKIEYINNEFNSQIIENKHASKTINNLLTKKEAEVLNYGTEIHEMLETTDFKNKSNNKYVNNLKEKFDFRKAIVYQELEFIFMDGSKEYHGIIDLMLEYDSEIKIIDYKLKNIDDEAYLKQLSVYYLYVRGISDKKINMYLYSILDNEVKSVDYKNKIEV